MNEPKNPHCADVWPHAVCKDYALTSLMEAASGAHAIARLLQADSLVELNWRDSDDPDNDVQPFSEWTRGGLHHALIACIQTVEGHAGFLAKRADGRRGDA